MYKRTSSRHLLVICIYILLASPYWNNDKTGDWISVLLITNLYIYTLRCLSNKLHYIYSMTSTASCVPERAQLFSQKKERTQLYNRVQSNLIKLIKLTCTKKRYQYLTYYKYYYNTYHIIYFYGLTRVRTFDPKR
jgi:hypothetical protein